MYKWHVEYGIQDEFKGDQYFLRLFLTALPQAQNILTHVQMHFLTKRNKSGRPD